MNDKRRNFIKTIGTLTAGAGVLKVGDPMFSSLDNSEQDLNFEPKPDVTYNLTILQTTDVHCQIHPHDEMFWEGDKAVFRKAGGYAQLATYFKSIRKKKTPSFIVDTGDMFQGSELSVKTTGKAIVPILNAMGYDLYIPGNWEVVYYKQAMQHLMGSLNAPKVCANMYHDLGNEKKGEHIFPPYYIWHTSGVKIGFLGYTDHLVPLRQSPNYSKGIIYTKPEENLAHYVDVLRNQEQCAFVIILAHLGLSQQLHLANLPQCEGVDYIFGGDTHERVRKPVVCKYAKVVEPGAFGSFVGKLDLSIKNGKIIKESYELVEISPKNLKSDKKIVSLISDGEKNFKDDINKVIGYSTIPLYRYFVIENTIDTMILDALSWQIPEMDIVLSNGFRFCPPKSTPDHTGNIPITNGFIFDMLPVDSPVRTGKVTGGQIMTWLEKELNNVFAKEAAQRFGGWVIKFKGMQISFYAFAENGKRVKEVTIGGKALELDKTYTICACERDGDPDDMLCRIRNVKDAKNTEYTLHEVLKSYLKANSPVTPKEPLSAKVMDAPQTLLSQVSGVDYLFT
ncbi:MAG: 5'-nucleotidase C-terminal domain-containing protein [Saprospiraceae bacterium]|nr:5'-nucleotidase C-terminal domain-containing protein [Saprospiraceae bacterium]